MKYLAVIPVRYKSSRFPGKVLTNILGKPMLSWVIEYAKKVFFFNDIIVATEDKEVASFVLKNHPDIKIFKNQRSVTCGTERLLEVSQKLPYYNMYVSLPADEPFVDFKEINKIQAYVEHDFTDDILTLYSKFFNYNDLESKLSCKIITNRDDHMLYNSRAVIPTSKSGEKLPLEIYKKHVGITFFPEYFLFKKGEKLWGDWHSAMSEAESLEQNRFIDFGARVKMLEIKHNYFGIDKEWQIPLIESRYKQLNK
jgi:3-deoxy-manno-octulosonate cytidylyltransferase (CMP-KDO synthetase)